MSQNPRQSEELFDVARTLAAALSDVDRSREALDRARDAFARAMV